MKSFAPARCAQDQVRVAGTDGHDRDVDRFAEPSHDGSGLLMVGGEHDDDCVGRLLTLATALMGTTLPSGQL